MQTSRGTKMPSSNWRWFVNSVESLNAAIDRKVLQHGAPATASAVHSDEEDPMHADLWLEVIYKDLGEVRLTLACRTIQLNCKGQEWLLGYAGLLV